MLLGLPNRKSYLNGRGLIISVLIATFALACQSPRWRALRTAREGPSDPPPIVSLVFTDSQHGWASIISDLWESVDGGKTWTERLDPKNEASAAFFSIQFRSKDDGWLFGSRGLGTSETGAIWRTNDGGRKWQGVSMPSTGRLVAADFCSERLGFANGANEILSTSDAGATWQSVFQGLPTDRFSALTCSGASGAWVLETSGAILVTSDAGTSWQRLQIPNEGRTLSKVYSFGARGWILGGGGLVLVSDDNGREWQRLQVPATEPLIDIRLVGSRGWLVGLGGTILRTTDGGMSWSAQASPTRAGLLTLAFADPDHWWIGGSEETVLQLR